MSDQTVKLDPNNPALKASPGMILRPDYVRGFVPTTTSVPSRLFYLLDTKNDCVWEVDAYRSPGENGRVNWMLVLVCPVCRNHLVLDSTKKKLEITTEGIESDVFRCSHDAQFGGVCPYQVALDRPSKSQRQVQVSGVWYHIDAVTRRA